MKANAVLFALLLSISFSAIAEPVKIGIITDLTGLAAQYGQQTRSGAQLAEQEIKEYGGDIQVIYEDDGLDAKRAVSAAQKLLFADKIDAAFMNFSGPSVAASPLFAQSKRVLIYSAGATSPLKNNPYAIKTLADFEEGCEGVAAAWKQKGISKIGHLKVLVEAGELCNNGVLKVFPEFKVLDFSPGDSLRSHALALKQAGIEAVLIGSYEADIINMVKAFDEIRYEPQLGAFDSSIGEELRKQLPDALDRFTTFGFVPVPNSFVSKIARQEDISKFHAFDHAALSYLAVKHLYAAVAACPGRKVECVLQKTLASPPDSLLSFERYEDREAVFPIHISSGNKFRR